MGLFCTRTGHQRPSDSPAAAALTCRVDGRRRCGTVTPMPCWVWRVLGLVSALAFAEAAVGAPISAGGLTFSDELGGFSILGVTGTGTLSDPFVVIEELHSSDDAVLVIRGLAAGFGNRIGTQHLTGFA